MGKGFDLRSYVNSNPAIQSAELSRAYAVHAEIINGAQTAQQGLYQMAQGFKTMRDEKLYKAMGYDTFADYCEKETGIKSRQVYNYISIIEKLPEDFVQRVAQKGVGMRSLVMLTTLTDEQREEAIETIDIESATVRELRERIQELTDIKTKAENEAEELRKRNDVYSEENLSLKNANKALDMLRVNQSDKLKTLKDDLDRMEKKKEELERQLVDITKSEEFKQLEEEKNKEVKAANDRAADLQEHIISLNSTIKELESRPVEAAVESNRDKEEIDRLNKALSKAMSELSDAKSAIDRLEDKTYKTFVVRMSLDEYKNIIDTLEDQKELFEKKNLDLLGIMKTVKPLTI